MGRKLESRRCTLCRGEGGEPITCIKCEGNGLVVISGLAHSCKKCKGEGIAFNPCGHCHGTGRIRKDGKEFRISPTT